MYYIAVFKVQTLHFVFSWRHTRLWWRWRQGSSRATSATARIPASPGETTSCWLPPLMTLLHRAEMFALWFLLTVWSQFSDYINMLLISGYCMFESNFFRKIYGQKKEKRPSSLDLTLLQYVSIFTALKLKKKKITILWFSDLFYVETLRTHYVALTTGHCFTLGAFACLFHDNWVFILCLTDSSW